MRSASCAGLVLCALGAAPLSAIQQAERAQPPFLFPDGIVFDLAFSKDGTLLAIACEDKAVRLYDCKTGKLVRTLADHNLRVWSIAFSPDGKRLACCTGDYREPKNPGEVKIWN